MKDIQDRTKSIAQTQILEHVGNSKKEIFFKNICSSQRKVDRIRRESEDCSMDEEKIRPGLEHEKVGLKTHLNLY